MESLMQTTFLGFTSQAWGAACASAVVVMAGLMTLRWVLSVRLGQLALRTANHVDDTVVEMVRRTRMLGFMAVALAVGAGVLGAPDAVRVLLRGILIVVTGMQVASWGNVVIAAAIAARARRTAPGVSPEASTLGVVGLAARGALYLVLILLVLDNLGINVSALVAGLGIGGVAIALAVQNILGDLFASLSIVLDRPFEVGDFIVVGDHMGAVEHVGLKTTRVRSLSGEQLVFANGDLLGSRIRNFKRMAERRVVFSIGVTYRTSAADLERTSAMLREIVTAEPGVRFDRAHFRSCDDSALTFEVVYYVLDPDYNRYMDIQQRINLEIVRRFESRGIDFAYPTRTLYVRAEPAASPGPGIRRPGGLAGAPRDPGA